MKTKESIWKETQILLKMKQIIVDMYWAIHSSGFSIHITSCLLDMIRL